MWCSRSDRNGLMGRNRWETLMANGRCCSRLLSWQSTFSDLDTHTDTHTLIQETSIEPQLNSVAQWQYILPSEKCIIVFIMLLRVTMGFLKREKKEKVCRGIQRLQRCRFFIFFFVWTFNDLRKVESSEAASGKFIVRVLYFSGHISTFLLMTLATEQTKKTRLFWPKKKSKVRKVVRKEGKIGRKGFSGVDPFHCRRISLFCSGTKWYCRSAQWSRRLTQFTMCLML